MYIRLHQEERQYQRAADKIVPLPKEVLVVRIYLGAFLAVRYRNQPERVHEKQYSKVAIEEIVPLVTHRIAHPEKDEGVGNQDRDVEENDFSGGAFTVDELGNDTYVM